MLVKSKRTTVIKYWKKMWAVRLIDLKKGKSWYNVTQTSYQSYISFAGAAADVMCYCCKLCG